ncbi:hypothetical protein YTPLAS18_05300 [Nitrospira sp.]|nr:hypothetical protein YTPLAS18_05300 [Nitrospira sp.]
MTASSPDQTEGSRLGTRPGLPLRAALLTVSLTAIVEAASPARASENSEMDSVAHPMLEFMKEEETISIASRYEQPISVTQSNLSGERMKIFSSQEQRSLTTEEQS